MKLIVAFKCVMKNLKNVCLIFKISTFEIFAGVLSFMKYFSSAIIVFTNSPEVSDLTKRKFF